MNIKGDFTGDFPFGQKPKLKKKTGFRMRSNVEAEDSEVLTFRTLLPYYLRQDKLCVFVCSLYI